MKAGVLSGLNTRAGKLLLLSVVLGLAACGDKADVTVHSQGQGQKTAEFMTRQGALESPGTQSLVIDLDANNIATIAVSDIVAHIADADLATFELLGAVSESGATLSLANGVVTYTGNPAQGWDRFGYKVCDVNDASVCATGVAHVVISQGVCSGLKIEENFRNATLTGDWVLGGNNYTAQLTAGGSNPVDADGDGWLRLSPTTIRQNGYAFFDQEFPASEGVSMNFEVASWGATNEKGGDGLIFFLVDGDKVDADNFEMGGCCGSLGYAPFKHESTDTPGMPHAVAGIAFDAWGGHWNTNEGRTGPDVLPPGAADDKATLPNNITVRAGAADSWKTIFVEQIDKSILDLNCDSPGCDTRPSELGPGRYWTTVTLTPKDSNSRFRMEIYVKTAENGSYERLIDTVIPQPLPDNLKLGLMGASGGGFVANHEVRNLSIHSVTDAQIQGTSSVPAGQSVSAGDVVTYTYTISNKTSGPICAADVNLVLPKGFTVTAQNCVAQKPNDSCGNFGTAGVTSDTVALDGDGTVTITITGTVAHSSNHPTADASGEVIVTGTQGDSNPDDNRTSSSFDFNEPTLRDRTLDILVGTSQSFDVHDDVIGGSNVDYTSVVISNLTPAPGVVITYDDVTGEFKVTVDRDYVGPNTVTVTYTIDNPEGTSPPATVTIKIAEVMEGSVGGSSDGEIWVVAGTPSVDVTMQGNEPIGSVTVNGTPTNSSNASSGSTTTSGSVVTFTPDAGKEGDPDSYTFEVEVCAQADPSNCDNVEVTVVYNDAPIIVATSGDQANAPNGRTSSLPFVAGPGEVGTIDPALTELVGGQTDGCAVNAAGNAVEFTPAVGTAVGTQVTCTLKVCEERPVGLCTTQDFVFTTIQGFHPMGETINGAQGETSTVTIANLIGNDGNVNAGSFKLVGTPVGGSVSIVNGAVEFVADADATDASFTYEICAAFDATECTIVTVTVNLAEKPDGQDRTIYVLETPVPVEVTVPSPFNDPADLDITVVSTDKGSATIAPNGDVLVTADVGYVGPVVVEVKGCTRTAVPACSTYTVTVIVNDLPVVADGGAIVTPGGTQSVSPVASAGQAGAINVASLALTSSATTPNGICGIDAVNGKVTFTANADATIGAIETCTIELCELAPAGACASAVFSFEVQDIFNPTDDDATTVEDTDLEISTDDLIGNDGNIEPGSFEIVGTPDANGAYETEEGGLLTPNVDGDGFVYTPPAGFTGEDSFTYEICSSLIAGDCEVVTVTITVEQKVVITGPADGATLEDTTPTVTGTSQPNTEVTITVDGTVVGKVIVDGDGNWTWTPDTELSFGPHTIGAEGENGSSGEVTVTIEEPAAPRAPVEITTPEDASSTDNPLPTITGTGEPGAEITISVDGVPVGTTTVDQDGNWSWTFETELEPGKYIVSATDDEGLTDSIELTVIKAEVPGPDFGITGPTDGSSTDNLRPTITGTGVPGSTVTITIDGEEVGTTTVDEDGTWSWTPDFDLKIGTVTIDAEDEFGDSDSIQLTITEEDAGNEDPLDGVFTGGRILGCASTGQGTSPVDLSLMVLLVGGAVLRFRRRK